MRAVAAIPAVALLAGCSVGFLVERPPPAPVVGLALCGCVAAAIGGATLRRGWCVGVGVGGAFLVGGILLASTAWQRAWRPPLREAFEELARGERAHAAADHRVLPADDEAFAIVEGVLRADATPAASGVSLSVDVDCLVRDSGPGGGAALASGEPRCVPAPGGVLANVAGALAADRVDSWRAGRRVRLPVMLHRPSRYLDPGVADGERALARRGTTLVGTVKSGGLVDVLSNGSAIDEALASTRAFCRRAIDHSVGRWSTQSAGIVAAIVIGDRGALDPAVQRRLQEAGTYHVIAISGGNIAILAALILGAFRVAGLLGRTAMIGSMALLVAYAAFVGGGASVDRATLMALVYFAARALDQRSDPLNALAVVAALIVAAQPLSIVDPAFLLTFGATLAILLVVPRIPRGVVPRFVTPALTMMAASAATEALLFPIGAAVFARVTFAGLALNFLAIPLMAVAQVAGMLVVPATLVSSHLAAASGWVAHLGAAGLVWSAALVRFAPAVAYRVAPPNLLVCGAYYAALVAAWTARRRCGMPAIVVAAAAAVWILAEPWTVVASRGDGRLHMTFIDVGQGDSAFVRFPRGKTMLVDTGGLGASASFDIGDRVVAPVLREAGVSRLDYVVLTHGDPDHIGGAPAIVEEFRPREMWEGIPVPRFAPLTALRLQAEAQGIRWSNIRAGDHIVLDGVDVLAIHPLPADWERQKVRNDDSIVLDVRWRDISVLLTGDIGAAVERRLARPLATASPARLRIIKIPHHGSLTSSTDDFVRAVHPAVAVVSAGRANHFGHPVPEVLARYRAAGAEIFRTDQDGAVTVETDGHALVISTFVGRQALLRRP